MKEGKNKLLSFSIENDKSKQMAGSVGNNQLKAYLVGILA